MILAGGLAAGCGAPPLPTDDADADSLFNIARQILPGDWQVVDEPVVFQFDQNGLPFAIYNTEDPDDWRTNVEFGTPRRIETPVGALSFVFQPNTPFIDSRTGEARFTAAGTGTDIQILTVPVPGSGYATARFTGTYNQETAELRGTIRYEIFYGAAMVYSDEHYYTLVPKTQ